MLKTAKERGTEHPIAISDLVPIELPTIISLFGLRYEELEELGGVRLANPWVERDASVAGTFNFVTRTITVAASRPPAERRFTIAHEIAHSLYDAGIISFRERGAVSSGPHDREEKSRERTANSFAAELLMPTELVQDAMIRRFGSTIDGTIPRDDLAYFLTNATRQRIEPAILARMPQPRRAGLFAMADNYQGRTFMSLAQQFEVSTDAMAIRLLELGLVT
ncbi:MAG: ImmA/IrrE family metallo-endopeptidase [Candidatus Binataceae bacterium]